MATKNPEFTRRLREAIQETGLKNRQFCEKAKIGYTTLMNYLIPKGIGRVPEWDQLIKISAASGKSIDWLLTGVGPQNAAAPGFYETADPLADCSPGTRYAVNKLIDILESNDPVVVPALQANLAAFHDSIGRSVEISKLSQTVKLLNGEVQNLRELIDPAKPRTGTD